MVEMTKLEIEQIVWCEWMLYVDKLSNDKGNGAGVILEGLNDIMLEYSLKFNFKATYYQFEYEVLVVSMKLAKE